ncbi:MAG TPA: hypothetical protein VLF87_01995, partial [Patescibacteria group bacterium]|nr:hypothetical protein [Patescibacteria group bacterium]
MGKQHIIELNGKRYDALTGTPVTNLPTGVAKAKALGKAIDGFRPVPQPARTVQKVSPPLKAPQKSKTLMRSSVRKPAPTVKPTTVVDGIVSHQATLPPDRLARAVSTPRSKLVRKFYDGIVSQGRSTPAVAAFKESTSATEAETDADPLQHQVDAAQSHTAPKLKKTRLSAKVAKRLRVKPRVVSAGTMALAAIL